MAVKKSAQTVHPTSPLTIILQWLTYAFWGWTAIAAAYLAAVIASYSLDTIWVTDSIEPIAYGIAATLILLPFSVVCDWLYSKREEAVKHGIASVVLIIHTVLYSLVAIGALIATAFSIVGLLLSTGDNTTSIVSIVVSVTLVILFTELIVRMLRPLLFKKSRFVFRLFMTLLIVAGLVWGAVGPVRQAIITKDDRAVRDGITNLSYAITQYVSTNDKLPEDAKAAATDSAYLGFIYPSVSSDSLVNLIDRKLITYTPNTKPVKEEDSSDATIDYKASTRTYYYELCGVFAHDLKERSWYSPVYSGATRDSEGYSMYIDEASAITAGTKCYKLSASYYKED